MAASSSASMPHVTEKPMAKTGARTEKMPLRPQAQGTSAGASALSRSSPGGRKLPSRKPIGATSRKTTRTRRPKPSPASRGRRGRASVLSSEHHPRDGVGGEAERGLAPGQPRRREGAHAARQEEGGEDDRERVVGVAEKEPEPLQQGDLDREVADPDGREEQAVAPAGGQPHAPGDEEAQREVDAQEGGGADRGGEEEQAHLHDRQAGGEGPLAREGGAPRRST